MSINNLRISGYSRQQNRMVNFIFAIDSNYIPLFSKGYDIFPSRLSGLSITTNYCIFSFPDNTEIPIKTKNIMNTLSFSSKFKKVIFPKSTITFFIKKSLIVTMENGLIKILLCGTYSTIDSITTYKTFIHPDLFLNTKYSRMKYYVNKYIIRYCTKNNDEILIKEKFEELVFNKIKISLKFQSLIEQKEQLLKLKTHIALTEQPTLPEPIEHPFDVEELVAEEVPLDNPNEIVGQIMDGISEITENNTSDGMISTINRILGIEESLDNSLLEAGLSPEEPSIEVVEITPSIEFDISGELTGLEETDFITAEEFADAEEPVAAFEPMPVPETIPDETNTFSELVIPTLSNSGIQVGAVTVYGTGGHHDNNEFESLFNTEEINEVIDFTELEENDG